MAHYLFNFTKKNADKTRSLRDQAAELLDAGLWGIGDKTANRESLAPGDRVLVYVGAPEQELVGHATIATPFQPWSVADRARYPGTFRAGVVLRDAAIWPHPVALSAIWSTMPASATNPKANFFGGVVRIKERDFAIALEAAEASPAPARTVRPVAAVAGAADSALFAAAEKLKRYLATNAAPSLSEDATRARLINGYIEALGYSGWDDVEYGVPVDSGDVADYVLKVDGRPSMVVEAKKLGHPLAAKEAAQVVKYASVLGVRWGLVTDGRVIKLYDPRVPDVPPDQRLVFDLDLASHADREDFEVRLRPVLELLRRDRLLSTEGLERHAAKEAVRDLLTSPRSRSVAMLASELKDRRLLQLSQTEVADLVSDLLD